MSSGGFFLQNHVDLKSMMWNLTKNKVELYFHCPEIEDYLENVVRKKLFWNDYLGTFQDLETKKLICVVEHGDPLLPLKHDRYKLAQHLFYIALEHQVPLEEFHMENFFCNVHGHVKFASAHVRKRKTCFASYMEALQHCFQKLDVEPNFYENKIKLLITEDIPRSTFDDGNIFEKMRLLTSPILSQPCQYRTKNEFYQLQKQLP